MSNHRYLTVHALTKYIKRKFDADPHLRNVYVKGELSNVNYHSSGNIFLTLKDEKTSIDGMIGKWDAQRLKFQLKRGMHLLVIGEVSVYEQQGRYRLYAREVSPDGVGSLHLAYEQLKEKLEKEGLFRDQWKQALPEFPQAIGIVTSKTGAVIQDIYTTIQRRYPLAKMILYPATVQGKYAAPSIVKAIQQANDTGHIDVLIVGRGGGSLEDLWAFNHEDVARAIFSSRIPVISAVGHETDFTIADFVADRRAPTPTAAAEMAVPAKEALMSRVLDRHQALYRLFSYKIKYAQEKLSTLQKSFPLQYPERLYRPFIENHIHLQERLQRNARAIVDQQTMEFKHLFARMEQYSPQTIIKDAEKELHLFTQRLHITMNHEHKKQEEKFAATVRLLSSLNPLHVIERGYAVVYKSDAVQQSVKQLKKDDMIYVKMKDGQIKANIQAIEEGEK